jgi:hypothetical protein
MGDLWQAHQEMDDSDGYTIHTFTFANDQLADGFAAGVEWVNDGMLELLPREHAGIVSVKEEHDA